jgi:Concanavalin A-like lectin/glucanases superfamily/FG-GAP repeat
MNTNKHEFIKKFRRELARIVAGICLVMLPFSSPAQPILTAEGLATFAHATDVIAPSYVWHTGNGLWASAAIIFPTNNFLVGTNNFSVSYWFNDTFEKPMLDGNGKDFIIFTLMDRHDSPINFFWLMFDPSPTSPGTNRITANFMDAAHYPNAANAYVDNLQVSGRWMFIAATVNRTNLMKLYVNGQMVGSTNITAFTNNFTDTGNLFVRLDHGGNPHSQLNPLMLAQMRFYQTELTASQISQIWNAGRGRAVDRNVFTSITTNGCYWELNDGSGTNPVGYVLTNRVWNTNGIQASYEPYGHPEELSWVTGGIVFSPPALPLYTTTTTVAGDYGILTPSGVIWIMGGDNQAFTATPNSLEYETNTVWTLDGGVVAQGTNTYTITNITTDHALAVTFQRIPGVYAIATIVDGYGTVTPTNGVTWVKGGSNLVFNATPWELEYLTNTVWALDSTANVVAQGTNTYTITNIIADHTLWVTFQETVASIANPIPATGDYFGWSVAGVGTNGFVVGAPNKTTGGYANAGKAFLYTNGVLAATIENPAPATGDNFGYFVAGVGINGFVIGAPNKTSGGYVGAGQAFLYTNGVLAVTITNPAPAGYDQFGVSVASLGTNGFVIGAPNKTSGGYANAGQAFLYTNGVLAATITNPAPAEYDLFGSSVAGVGINGFVIGAPYKMSGGIAAGQAFLYTNEVLAATITNPTPVDDDLFGSSVAGVGTNGFVIGSPYGGIDGTGEAYLYTNGVWAATIANPDPATGGFGYFVAGVGTNGFVVGSPYETSGGHVNAGQAFLYTNGVWAATFVNPDPADADLFGWSVAGVGTNQFVVGAPTKTIGGNSGVGQVYIFTQ